MSAPTSLLAKCMRARLGDALWAEFVSHANAHYKQAFVSVFEAPTLRCVGPLSGGPCPHAFAVDQKATEAKDRLECLHLDHERPLHLTCARWSAQLPARPISWDDGLDGGELCHALFGVHNDDVYGVSCVRFRCGPRRGVSGGHVPFAHHSYCHTS